MNKACTITQYVYIMHYSLLRKKVRRSLEHEFLLLEWMGNLRKVTRYFPDDLKDHIITSAGPIIVFRTDNLVLDFKHLFIREIQPPFLSRENFANAFSLIN